MKCKCKICNKVYYYYSELHNLDNYFKKQYYCSDKCYSKSQEYINEINKYNIFLQSLNIEQFKYFKYLLEDIPEYFTDYIFVEKIKKFNSRKNKIKNILKQD